MDIIISIDETGWYEPSVLVIDHEPFNPWDVTLDNSNIIGDPSVDTSHWRQQDTAFTCAVVSQQMILESFGIEISEAQLVYEATSNGWLTEDGTQMEDVGNLLEAHGIDTHTVYGGRVEDLINELRHGHKIIVALDSSEIWSQDWLSNFFEDITTPFGADHAVQVTGLDMSNPDAPMVILNDPGHPDGAGMSVPLEQFADAWHDSGEMYLATDDAPPNLFEHSIFGANFNMTEDGSGQYMNDGFWTKYLEKMLTSAEEGINLGSAHVPDNAAMPSIDDLFELV